MSFDIDWDCLPATLNCQPMTDEEFMAFCQEHPDLNFEMTAEGKLIVMCPSPFLTGARGAHLIGQLRNWTELYCSVIIYRPGGETETRTGIDSIEGEGPVATFTLELESIWQPI